MFFSDQEQSPITAIQIFASDTNTSLTQASDKESITTFIESQMNDRTGMNPDLNKKSILINKENDEDDDSNYHRKSFGEKKIDNREIVTKDIKIQMKLVQGFERTTTKFYLYENQMEKKFASPLMPNVSFYASKGEENETDDELTNKLTRVKIKIVEISSSVKNKDHKTINGEKLVGNFELVMRADQRMKDYQFYDDFKNKVMLKLKRAGRQ